MQQEIWRDKMSNQDYLSHYGKPGMKWGYNDGRRNGKDVARGGREYDEEAHRYEAIHRPAEDRKLSNLRFNQKLKKDTTKTKLWTSGHNKVRITKEAMNQRSPIKAKGVKKSILKELENAAAKKARPKYSNSLDAHTKIMRDRRDVPSTSRLHPFIKEGVSEKKIRKKTIRRSTKRIKNKGLKYLEKKRNNWYKKAMRELDRRQNEYWRNH